MESKGNYNFVCVCAFAISYFFNTSHGTTRTLKSMLVTTLQSYVATFYAPRTLLDQKKQTNINVSFVKFLYLLIPALCTMVVHLYLIILVSTSC